MVKKLIKCITCHGMGICDDGTPCVTCEGSGEMRENEKEFAAEPCFDFSKVANQ